MAKKKKQQEKKASKAARAQRVVDEAPETVEPEQPPPARQVPAKMKTRSAVTRRKAVHQDIEAIDEALETVEPELLQFKEDVNAFNAPVEDGKDYISNLPSEMLDNVLSYCVLDHEPGLAVRQKNEGLQFVQRPHVLLSLAAMSKYFKAHVESFSLREMMKHKDIYRFKSNADVEEGKRRSSRLKSLSVERPRCYRFELVSHIQIWCIKCNSWCTRSPLMANTVRCHEKCGSAIFANTIDLTTSLKKYDLRDWMLIKTRISGPRVTKRAEELDLPTIPYGTIRVPKPFYSGMTTSYRFYECDVKTIAKLVHGNVKAHMESKREKQKERKAKNRRKTHRELKIRWHTDVAERAQDRGSEKWTTHHLNRLKYYEELDIDTVTDSDGYESGNEYGNYYDLHERLCQNRGRCTRCFERNLRTYASWY